MFLSKKFLKTRSILTILPKNFPPKVDLIFAHSAKMMKSMYISQKRTSKQSPVDVECSFDKPAGNFCRKCAFFCSRSGNCKTYIIVFPKKTSKLSFGHVEFKFCNTAEILSQKSKMLLLKVCKRWKNYQLFFRKCLSKRSLGHVGSLFDNPGEVFCQDAEMFSGQGTKNIEKKLIFSKKFFVRTFFRITRKQL